MDSGDQQSHLPAARRKMLLLILLLLLPCLLPLNLVLGVLLGLFLLPLFVGCALTVFVCLLPHDNEKPSLAERVSARPHTASTDWHDGRLSRMRPWAQLPQWERAVICEGTRRAGQPAESRDAARRAVLRPVRH